jgi:tRNA (mo5U34)-methyltransferase
MAERRGAQRVVAVDTVEISHFGFDQLRNALDSNVEFLRASVYELPELLEEPFDIVICLGVLYHLRHPLLAIDSLRRLTHGMLFVESAVAGEVSDAAEAKFYRFDQLNGDGSNWFAPNVSCLIDWVESSGFKTDLVTYWPSERPGRASLRAIPLDGEPEYRQISLEVPLTARVLAAG